MFVFTSAPVGVGHKFWRAMVSKDGLPRVAYSFRPSPGHPLLLVPLELADGVGNDPDSVPLVRRTNVGSRYAMPLRVIPDRGQVSEDGAESAAPERGDVFDDHPPWSKVANESSEVSPQTRPLACKTSTFAGEGDVLARKSAADEVDPSVAANKLGCVQLRDVVVAIDTGPTLGEHLSAVGFDFAEGNGAHAGALKPEAESADAGEEVEDIHGAPRRTR